MPWGWCEGVLRLLLRLPLLPVCFIPSKELSGLKGWVQLEEKASFCFFEGLKGIRLPSLDRSLAVAKLPRHPGDPAHQCRSCVSGRSPLFPTVTGESWGRCACGRVTAFLGLPPTHHTWLTELCISRRTASKIHCSRLTRLQTVSSYNQLSVS